MAESRNLSEVLRGGLPHDLALIESAGERTRTFTYGALNAWVDGLAGGLGARFAGRPFRAALLARNSAEFVALYFAIMRAGGTAVPFNWRAGEEALSFLIEDAGIDLVVTDDPDRTAPGRDTLVIGSPEWVALHREGPWEAAPVGPEDIAQILYTSGSTGRPKGVPLSHAGQFWAVEEAARMVPDGGGYRVLVAAPLFHMNALFNLKRSFQTGATVVLLPAFAPEAFARAVQTFRADWVTGVPTMAAMLARHLGEHVPKEFAGVRRVFIGSAPYGESLFAGVRRLFPGAAIFNAYGTTEAGPTVYGAHPDGLPTPALSCGYPLFPAMIRLVADGAVVEGEGEGSLQMRTPATMRGYLNRPEINAEVLREGWYDSRDVMRRDADGFHHFVGRADDMFNSGGENIYPAEVERVLERHAAIEQVIVVPVPDEIKYALPVAFVVPRGGASVDEAAVKAWFIARAPAYLHPRRVFVVPEIPLAQTGKVDRAALKARARDLVAQGTGTP